METINFTVLNKDLYRKIDGGLFVNLNYCV